MKWSIKFHLSRALGTLAFWLVIALIGVVMAFELWVIWWAVKGAVVP